MRKITRKLPVILIIIITIIFIVRLVQWQFINGETYQNLANSSSSYTVKLEAARGEILDTNGEILAGSTITYNVVMDASKLDGERNSSLANVLEYMREYDIEWIDRLPITIENGEYVFKENTESEQTYLLGSNMLNMDSDTSAVECMEALVERYNCTDYNQEDALDIISIRYGMTKTGFSLSEPYIIAEDVPLSFVEIISENSSEIPAIEIKTSSKRDYEDGSLLPHILGTVGLMSSEQYNTFSEEGNIYSSSNLQGYSYNDLVGKSGVELYFESDLRGENGSMTVITETASSEMQEIITAEPVDGNNIYLTIDSDLQEMANYSLEKYINQSSASDCYAGAVVVLDVETFGVLAASTYPSYDLGLYQEDSSYYTELLNDEELPLFNRAFNGQFTSGSVMKPLVAIAALEEGVITEDTVYYCDKVYDYYESAPLACIGSHSVGFVSLNQAIYCSCNSFFCEAGRLLGIEAMEVYANLFSLGEKTGLEIYESSGIMTNPEEYEENHGESWVEGVTIQAAIGQADSMFTPLQLATYCATIANDGVRLSTHIYDKTTNYDNSEIIDEYEVEIAADIGISLETMEIVQSAMLETTTTGTASNVFSSYGIAIAAKTGTAQNPNNSDSVTFIAYAPYDDPEIAVAVVIEYGAESNLAKYVAKDIFDSYFYGITVEDKINEW